MKIQGGCVPILLLIYGWERKGTEYRTRDKVCTSWWGGMSSRWLLRMVTTEIHLFSLFLFGNSKYFNYLCNSKGSESPDKEKFIEKRDNAYGLYRPIDRMSD
jgi:hypothetical protein